MLIEGCDFYTRRVLSRGPKHVLSLLIGKSGPAAGCLVYDSAATASFISPLFEEYNIIDNRRRLRRADFFWRRSLGGLLAAAEFGGAGV